MNKILIIGQALPAVKQTSPYDTTLLYDMLSWVGIDKEQAQKMFEFDAVCNEFTGHGQNGHLKPTQAQMNKHWDESLETKVQCADKVWLLGNVAKDYFNSKPKTWSCNLKVLETIHPSKRNYDRIMKQKNELIYKLSHFLNPS